MEDSGNNCDFFRWQAQQELWFMLEDMPASLRQDCAALLVNRDDWVDAIADCLRQEIARHEQNPKEMPLRFPYAAFTLLALLVSARFGELLRELCGLTEGAETRGLWEKFAPVRQAYMEARNSFEAELVHEMSDRDRRARERYWAEREADLPKVWREHGQELGWERRQGRRDEWDFQMWWEKKEWKREQGITPFGRRADGYWPGPLAYIRDSLWIHLAVDPFAPVEVAAEKITTLLRQKQNAYIEAIRRDLERIGAEPDDAETERLRFDVVRSFEGNKRVRGKKKSGGPVGRGPETKFSLWLRALRIYDLMQNRGCAWQAVARTLGSYADPESDSTRTSIGHDKGKAQILIDAAWQGLPLAAIKLEYWRPEEPT